MMKTFTKVRGYNRSNVVNNVLLLPTLARRITLQVKDDDDLYKGQRSTEFKCGKLCSMAAIFGHKNS